MTSPYAAQPATPVYAYAPPRRTNGLAIAAFVLGLLSFSILPVIFGHIALGQIKRTGDSGTVFAVIGLVLGYIQIAVIVVAVVLLASGVVFALFTRGTA